jgi:hypothetical protein
MAKIIDSAPVGDAASFEAVLATETGLIAIQKVVQAVTAPSVKPSLAAIATAVSTLVNDA